MDGFFATLKQIFDAFGNYITVPIIIYVICRIFKTPRKRAFQSAVLVGVGLMGMSFVTTAFGGVLTPLITRMVDASGLSKPALDIGWQAVAAVCYSTDLGMMFIGVGLLFQIVLWFGKWTDIFMPSDLWNNYSISVWGSFLFLLTGNMPLAFGLMLFINLVILLIAEAVQKRWSTYYNYPGCAMTAPPPQRRRAHVPRAQHPLQQARLRQDQGRPQIYPQEDWLHGRAHVHRPCHRRHPRSRR